MPKKLKTRVALKTDSYENWAKATEFIPMAGEVVVYTNNGTPDKIKIGDGSTTVGNLPFFTGSYNLGVQSFASEEVPVQLVKPDGTKSEVVFKAGTNIALVNNGDNKIVISASNSQVQIDVDETLSTESTNPVQNKVITGALNSHANNNEIHVSEAMSSDIETLKNKTYSLDVAANQSGTVNLGLKDNTNTLTSIPFVAGDGISLTSPATGTSMTISIDSAFEDRVSGAEEQIDNLEKKIHPCYGTCSTTGSTAAKTVVCSNFVLTTTFTS